jgi:uncharacterized protein (TIGR03437 family)
MRFAFFLIAAQAIAGDFTTSLGDAYPYAVSAITTDAAGNTYVVGSRTIPGSAAFRIGTDGLVAPISFGSDVFVSKLDPNGKLLFTDTFGGKGIDSGTAIALDPSGNIYIAGTTSSPDFPLSRALQTQIFPAGVISGVPVGSGFIMKLSNDGTMILYSTFFGGTLGQSAITSLATDSKGNLYLTGVTLASDFPHTAGMPFGKLAQNPSTPGAIVASISAAGDKILYSGVIAMATPCTSSCINLGGVQWNGVGIAVDAAGNAYIAGNDPSATNLPTTAGVLAPNGIGAFVAKINAGGTGLGYLTYIGSGEVGNNPFYSADNTVYAITVDAAGNVYLAGATDDPNFPVTPGSYQSVSQSPTGTNGFLAKLNPTGSAMVWATYFAGSPQSIAVDAGGNLWATGTANPPTVLPNTDGWSTGPEYLAELNASGAKLTYSALYPAGTIAQSVAVDPSGLVHTAGSAGFVSSIAPTAAPSSRIFAFQSATLSGPLTARLSPAEVIAIYGPGIGPAASVSATPVNGFYPTTLGGVQVAINGASIPLLYVSATQINAIVPMGLPLNASATVRVTNGSATGIDYPVWIVASTPAAFAPVLNQDGTVNSQSNPAHGGSIVTLFATGWQSNFAPLADGQVATAAQDFCLGACQANVSLPIVPFGPQLFLTATALYGGTAPGFPAGVTQFNVQLPTASSTIDSGFSLTVGNSSAGVSATVWIQLP